MDFYFDQKSEDDPTENVLASDCKKNFLAVSVQVFWVDILRLRDLKLDVTHWVQVGGVEWRKETVIFVDHLIPLEL